VIRELATEQRIRELCELFEVSSSGYYAWRRRGRGARVRANEVLGEEIEEIHLESRQNYGSPRITKALHARGHSLWA
jgi:putative transposase